MTGERPAICASDVKPVLDQMRRRSLLRGGFSLGALTMLTGCDLSTHSGVDGALEAMLRFDDRVQQAQFSKSRLAENYPASAITKQFRFNAYYPEWQVRVVDPATWQLGVGGLVHHARAWSLAELRTLPQQSQITRHICIEGWSQIGQWSGIPLHRFLQRIGADTRAKYVNFTCFDGYSTSLDMPSALQPQTILALDFGGKPLTPEWGAPLRLRIPTKLGYKSAKNLQSITVTNTYPGGYWENQGYDWYAGV